MSTREETAMPRRSVKLSVALSTALIIAAQFSVGASPVLAATTLTTCDSGAFRQAVAAGGTVEFGVDCPALTVSPEIVIPAGLDVTISANGHAVTLDGQGANRHFLVQGGRLALQGITLRGGTVVTGPGELGRQGATRDPAASGSFGEAGEGCAPAGGKAEDGEPGGEGTPGDPGETGDSGEPSADARGGSLLIESGTVELVDVVVRDNRVASGDGGAGGAGGGGGAGGAGGSGGNGGEGTVDSLTEKPCPQGGRGGDGGPAGSGGIGGAGGTGGPAGEALGGAVFNGGTLTLVRTQFLNNTAEGGDGGQGGAGGAGGIGGQGGQGGSGGLGASGDPPGTGGSGGNGNRAGATGRGGDGGRGGLAGNAAGGAVVNQGSMTVSGGVFAGNRALGGRGGSGGDGASAGLAASGGAGGFGGPGGSGPGGTLTGGTGGDGGDGGPGPDGAAGGAAQSGGLAFGGDVDNRGSITMNGTRFSDASTVAGLAQGGVGGRGGSAGQAGQAGSGGAGGPGVTSPEPSGAPGSSGGRGGNAGAGGRGGDAGPGGPGGVAFGGAINNSSSATLTTVFVVLGSAVGGPGGPSGNATGGGRGGDGGIGGAAGSGANAAPDGKGGSGGSGAAGGSGGNGGSGGAPGQSAPGGFGGDGNGGAIANLLGATMTVSGTLGDSTARAGDGATGSIGSTGGPGGPGGPGASGGSGGFGQANPSGVGGNGGAGADGGSAGTAGTTSLGSTAGGTGGAGGIGRGGGLYNNGDLHASGVVIANHAVGGNGGAGGGGSVGAAGGAGGQGGNGGVGGGAGTGLPTGTTSGLGAGGHPGNGRPGDAGARGGNGSRGGDGGPGGDGLGGGIHNESTLAALEDLSFTLNDARSGSGGSANRGGNGSRGGDGGRGGGGGAAGAGEESVFGGGGSNGGAGGHGGDGAPAGRGGDSGSAIGGAIYSSTAVAVFARVTFGSGTDANRVIPAGSPGTTPCLAPGQLACAGGGPGGDGGLGGTGGFGTGGEEPGQTDGADGADGVPGDPGGPGGSGSAGTAGQVAFPNCTEPPCGIAGTAQTITFTSTAPAGAVVGGPTYAVSATATSGLPVTFSIDAAATSVCALSGATVSFVAVGTCVIDADQPGGSGFAAAPRVQQTFAVGPAAAAQTITFTSTAPIDAVVGGPTYTVSAAATSGLPVTFSIDSTASGVCAITGSSVSFLAAGSCVIDADQAGGSGFAAAPRVQQTFTVGAPRSQTITFTSTAPTDAVVNGPTYTVSATATSGLPVTFSIDPAASGVCTVTVSTVSFQAPGTCVINADQAGGSGWAAAPRTQQAFAVGSAPAALTITTTSPLPAGVFGRAYDLTFVADGGSGDPTWSLASKSKLPRGVALSAAGRLAGTPAQTGTFTFTVQARVGTSVATKAFALTIAPALAITTKKLNAASVGADYSATLTASGGIAPRTWSISGGALPAGLSLDSATGVISGTPTTRGSASFTVTATDAGGGTATKALSLRVT